jgi:hypothetical protein
MNRKPLFLILKIILIQAFFLLSAYYGPKGYGLLIFNLGLLLVLLNYYFVKSIIAAQPYFFLALIFFLVGFLQNTLFIHLNLISMNSTFPPIWFPTLWMTFILYYGDVFKKMLHFPLWLMGVLGSLGGCLAHLRGLKYLHPTTDHYYFFYIACVWFFFMPFSLVYFRYFMQKKIANKEVIS